MAADTGDRGSSVVAVSVVMIAVTALTCALRLWSRFRAGWNSFGLDDVFAFITVPLTLVFCALSIYWVCLGFGQHMQSALADGHTKSEILMIRFIIEWIYNTGISTVRLSALFLYSRSFQPRWIIKYSLWATVGLIVAWWATACGISTAACSPVKKNWEPNMPGSCMNLNAVYAGLAVPNIVLDCIVLILPLPVFWSIGIGVKGKYIQIIAVCIAGFSTTCFSVARLIYVGMTAVLTAHDFTWEYVVPQILALLEIPFALVAVSLPTIWELFKPKEQIEEEKRPTVLLLRNIPRSDRNPPAMPDAVQHPADMDYEALKELNLLDGHSGNNFNNHVEVYALRPDRSWGDSITSSDMERVHVRTSVAVRMSYGDDEASSSSQPSSSSPRSPATLVGSRSTGDSKLSKMRRVSETS